MNPASYCCPQCQGSQLKVLLTQVIEGGVRVRRRKCESCGHRWYTVQEQEQYIPSWRVGYIAKGRKLFLHEPAGSPR